MKHNFTKQHIMDVWGKPLKVTPQKNTKFKYSQNILQCPQIYHVLNIQKTEGNLFLIQLKTEKKNEKWYVDIFKSALLLANIFWDM